jgi:hypothetical protein
MMALRINMKRVRVGLISAIALAGGFFIRTVAFAQSPSETFPPVTTVRQLMLDLIHPSSNDILLATFRGGVGNLVVLELGRDDSGILVMPRERVAFLVRPTDFLLMNVHHMHGNLKLTVGGTRLTAVLYARQHIDKCR